MKMLASLQKPTLQQLVDKPAESDPRQTMQEIHTALTDKAAPVSLNHSLIPPLLAAFNTYVERGVAADAFNAPQLTTAALHMATELAEIYLPVFKRFAPIGKARRKLEQQLAKITPLAEMDLDQSTDTSDLPKTSSPRSYRVKTATVAIDNFAANHHCILDRPPVTEHWAVYNEFNPYPAPTLPDRITGTAGQHWAIK